MTIRTDNKTVNGVKYKHTGTHVTHCCERHGCKYNDNCVVVDKIDTQQYPCERCHSSAYLAREIKSLEEEIAWSKSLEARGLKPSGYDEMYDPYDD